MSYAPGALLTPVFHGTIVEAGNGKQVDLVQSWWLLEAEPLGEMLQAERRLLQGIVHLVLLPGTGVHRPLDSIDSSGRLHKVTHLGRT